MKQIPWFVMIAVLFGGTWVAAQSEVAREYPPTFHWKDRRPIGTSFLATSGKNWARNPRGWFNDPNLDALSAEGRRRFVDRMMKLADDCVEHAKRSDAQGVIVWDLEGEEMPHAVSYLGDPRILPEVAPEMDAIADAFFKKFLDAGLRTGICIRPSSIVFKDPAEPGKYPWIKGRYGHVDNDDPAGVLIDKIAYAKKRWNCTIFYIDTNFTPVRENGQLKRKPGGAPEFRMLSPEEIRAVHRAHPDVLLAPEFQQPGYFASSSGYGEYTEVGDFAAAARRAYPDAFRIWMPRLNADDVYLNWDAFIEKGIKAGDVFFFECAPMQGEFGPLLRRAMEEASDESAPPGDLAELLKTAAKSESWVARRRAIAELEKHHDDAATEVLATIVQHNTNGLELFAARSLGRQGTPRAMESLNRAIESGGRPAVAAAHGLGASGNPQAVETLVKLISADSKDFKLRWAALDGLGDLKAKEAVDPIAGLIMQLRTTGGELSRRKAIIALEQIGDVRAVEPLAAALTESGYERLRPRIGKALMKITGNADAKNPSDPKTWERWREKDEKK